MWDSDSIPGRSKDCYLLQTIQHPLHLAVVASTLRVKQPVHEAGHLLVYLVCICLCTVLVRTDFEKFNFHPKYVNNFCICIVIEVLNGQTVMCVGFLSAVIVQSTSKTKYVLTAMNLSGSVFGFGKTEIYVIYLFVHICLCHWLSAF